MVPGSAVSRSPGFSASTTWASTFLIAGTYTPIAWGLMRGPWLWGTLTAAWTTAIVCGTRVLCGSLMPMWLSTLTYLVMGWGALFCYNELARTHSHRKLLLLPLGGLFYSVGAVMNLTHWPALVPGVFAAHEIFHFFVITGTTCHVLFMLGRRHPVAGASRAPAPSRLASRSERTPALPLAHASSHVRAAPFLMASVGKRSRRRPLSSRTGDELRPPPADNAVEVA